MLLVDTSAWIEFFRRPSRLSSGLGDIEELVMCLPVLHEVLQGFRDEGAFRVARDALTALPMVESPITEPLVLEAVDLYRAARRRGITVRSSVDCLIAACALRHGLTVLHRDRDYAALSAIAPLRAREVVLT